MLIFTKDLCVTIQNVGNSFSDLLSKVTDIKGEAGPYHEPIGSSGHTHHSGAGKAVHFWLTVELSSIISHVHKAAGSLSACWRGRGEGVVPSGWCRRPCLHQAPLTLGKLRVHDCRGGTLEKRVILVRKANVVCQHREEDAGLWATTVSTGGGRGSGVGMGWAHPPVGTPRLGG